MGGGEIELVGMVRITGELEEEAVKMALEELAGMEEVPDKVVVGGPAKSLVGHDVKQNRGFHRRDHTSHQGKVLRLFFLDIVLIIPELLACSWCWCELVHAVPMLSSRLILSLPSTGCTVYRHVRSLPIGAI
jgi:hypothetical protein